MTEILIAGGGPSGLAAAIALAERGMNVSIVDQAGGLATERGELLPEGASAIVERLGLTDVLATALPIEDVVSKWGQAKLQSHGGQPHLGLHGWGINRLSLSRAMLRRVETLGLRVQTGRIAAVAKTPRGWQVDVTGGSDPDVLRADYLIDATGRPAIVARKRDATLLQGADLVAVVWQAPERGDARMLTEAAPDGWWYSIPHPDGVTVGFVTSAQRAREVAQAPAECLSSARDTLTMISVGQAPSAARLMDARSARLDTLCGPGWLATGDAATAFDPIASQGLFNALSGGFFAGHAAADAVNGDEEAPLVYEALASRTAERTFSLTHLQYAARPHDTSFWRQRSNVDAANVCD